MDKYYDHIDPNFTNCSSRSLTIYLFTLNVSTRLVVTSLITDVRDNGVYWSDNEQMFIVNQP